MTEHDQPSTSAEREDLRAHDSEATSETTAMEQGAERQPASAHGELGAEGDAEREGGVSEGESHPTDAVGASQTAPTDEAEGARADGEGELGDEHAPLFSREDADRFRQRWENLQAGFVDQPQQMVEQADDLVSQLMQELTAGFNEERARLEAQWGRGEETSTEELRVAMTRYRSFFTRLLSV